jgi:hypothetical protein
MTEGHDTETTLATSLSSTSAFAIANRLPLSVFFRNPQSLGTLPERVFDGDS